jgi:hypothetical protein
MNPSYIVTQTGISVVLNGKPYNASATHTNYNAILAALKAGEFDLIPHLINPITTLKKYIPVSQTTIDDLVVDYDASTITYCGEDIHNTLVSRIFEMHASGFNIKPMINLLGNIYLNPSKKAIDEMYTFLDYGKMPITDDGYFLAYKRVNANFTSCYDGKTKNDIGRVVSMPRFNVDDRSEITCSSGLHICSFEYLQHYTGAKVIYVKVNPKDVVSIPTDYNNTKARVCEYTVLGELTYEEANLPTHSFGTPIYNTNITDEDDDSNYYNSDYSLDEEYDDYYTDEEDDIRDEADENEADENEADENEADVNDVEEDIDVVQHTMAKITFASEQYIQGYKEGHFHGRRKIHEVIHVFTNYLTTAEANEYRAGYNNGYKDGKNHKKQLFK